MGIYSRELGMLTVHSKKKASLEAKLASERKQLLENQEIYVDLLQAQQLLTTVSDDNTESTLTFITSVINKALAEVFKGDARKIELKKKLYAGNKPHINIELTNSEGNTIDLAMQSGTGLQQIVSVLFTICLIEIRKGRRFLILDEKLSGLHKSAKRIMSEILQIFTEGGFQFIFVEYSLNDFGKIYNVEKPGMVSKIYDLEGEDYDDTSVFLFSEGKDLGFELEDEE